VTTTVSTPATAARAAKPKSSPQLRRRHRRELLRNLAFLSPWLLGTGLFFLYPLVTTFWLSFTHYDGFTSPVWVGTQNWKYVFQDYPFFWPALRNTVWFVIVLVSLRLVTGLILGMTVINVKRGSSVLRTKKINMPSGSRGETVQYEVRGSGLWRFRHAELLAVPLTHRSK